MVKYLRNINLLITIVIFGAFLATNILPVSAQNTTGSGLSISPTLFELSLKPTQSTNIDINLKNITVDDVNAKAFINDFTADNVTGNPKIITDPSAVSPHSIKRFVGGLADVPLKVGEQKKVSLTVTVPDGTAPGAYYGIIRYKAIPAGANAPAPGQVALSASVGSIVLVTVPGNLKEQIQVHDIHVYSGPHGEHEGIVFFKKPTQVGVEIANLGNGFSQPFGTVEVKNMYGKTAYNYQLNNTQPRGNILPSSTRNFKNPIKNINQIGRYTVTANVTYGTGSQVLVYKKTFWYIPLWLAIIILAALIILVLIILRAFRSYRQGVKHSYRHR